jgi:uncharacterized membrane protein YhaH (DUF805 family)
MRWYLEAFRKYAEFDGRARRKEYWFFALFNFLAAMGLMLVAAAIGALFGRDSKDVVGFLLFVPISLYWLAILIPSLAVTVRRLHDTGRSGWWWLISFVPFVGGIILLVFTVLEGDPGPNMYGPDPKVGERYAALYPPAAGY